MPRLPKKPKIQQRTWFSVIFGPQAITGLISALFPTVLGPWVRGPQAPGPWLCALGPALIPGPCFTGPWVPGPLVTGSEAHAESMKITP